MDSTSEIGPLIIEAGDVKILEEIKRRFGDDREFRRICELYSDFSTDRCILHQAAEKGNFDICKFLIKNVKVCIDASTYQSWDTPLILAAKEEHVKIVEYLINHGAAINMANFKGLTALHHAVLKDNWEIMKLLLLKGARTDADSVDGTPLQIAVSHGNVEAVDFLLSRGEKEIIQNEDSTTQNLNAMDSTSEIGALIIKAGANGDLKKLKEIKRRVDDDIELRRICDEYSDFSTGWSVLHHAAKVGHFEICKFLIKGVGVFIDASSYRKDTPLMLAAKEERVKIVEYLIKQGALISMGNIKGFTALHYALQKDNMELMKLLLTKGALKEVDSVDGTPLQCAASRGNLEAVKLLLSHGAQPNANFVVEETSLVCAIKARSFECMDVLLKAKADPEKYFIGLSPLSLAAREGDTRYLKSLLEAGADPNSPMTDLLKPIEDAASVHNREGVEILFPLTDRLEYYPNWSVDGIMEYFHSEEFIRMREEKRSLRLLALDKSGQLDISFKNYNRAVLHYRMASQLDPSNPEWISKRSLCHAHGGREPHALFDAEKCLRFEPRFPAAHHGGDATAAAAAQIFKKIITAGLAFTLDPVNHKTEDAYRVALFDYFAWLYQMSSPDEILIFTRK